MIALDSGDKIRGDASVAEKVDYVLSGTDANAIKQMADGQLADEITDIYTADSVDAVTGIICVNTHDSAITMNLYLTPFEGSARRIIPKDMTLGIGWSLYADGRRFSVIDASGQIQTTFLTNFNDLTDVTLTSEADHDMLYYDNATSLWKNATPAAILAQLSGQAGAAFDWNSQQLDNVKLNAAVLKGTFTADGAVTMPGFRMTDTLVFDSPKGIQAEAATGHVYLYIDPIATDGSSNAYIRMFRTASTSGARQLVIYKGDGSATVTFVLDAPTGNITTLGSIAAHSLTGALDVAGQYITFLERAAPGAGAENEVRVYAIVGGDTFTDLSAVFQDGSIDNFATESTPDNSPLFVTPSRTKLEVELRKDHPGIVRIVAIFPNGEEFDLKHHEYHDPIKIAANKGAENPLPSDWLVESKQQIADRLEAEGIARRAEIDRMNEEIDNGD